MPRYVVERTFQEDSTSRLDGTESSGTWRS